MRRAAREGRGGIGGVSVVRRDSPARWVVEAAVIVRIPVVRVSRVRSAPVRTGVVRALVTVVREPEREQAWVRVSAARVVRVLAVRGKTLCAPRTVGLTSVRTLR